MSRRRAVAHVAAWEFRRYVKPKQQIIGLLLTFLILVGAAWLNRRGDEPSIVDVALVPEDALPAIGAEQGRFRFERHPRSALPGLIEEVEQRDRQAVLVVHDDRGGELHTRQDPGWRAALETELTSGARLIRLDRSGIDARDIAAISAPFELTLHEYAPRAGRTERLVAVAALVLMMIGLFSGVGYIFASVTGEKQNRLSEQVISTIPPQAWIDGKILGLAGVSIVAIVNFITAGLLYLVARRVLWGEPLQLPASIGRPELLLLALLFVALGFFFWFAFLVAVAAIIDDPHTSTRNQLLFLPMLTAVPAFMAIGDAGATWVRTLAIAPPTSATVMPVRLLVTDVPAWEILLALLLLVASIAVVRTAAARVFRLGMLMYGKEPTWAEVRRWIRET